MPEPIDLKYAKTHEWARIEGDVATIGITQHAQEELGDVALVLLPEVGRMLHHGEKFGEIESIKAVSDLYTPVNGEVIEVNETLTDSPETVNDAPYGDGWLMKVKLIQPDDSDLLLSSTEYEALL